MSSPDVPPSFYPHHLWSETFPPTDSSQLLLHDDRQKCRPAVVRERNSSKLNKLLFFPQHGKYRSVKKEDIYIVCFSPSRKVLTSKLLISNLYRFYAIHFWKRNFYRTKNFYSINIYIDLFKITCVTFVPIRSIHEQLNTKNVREN